jgi:uncharacterized protein YjbI with pentapeptide repeats
MADEQLLERLLQGAESWNAWRLKCSQPPIDLRDAQQRGFGLTMSDLGQIGLREFDFARIDLCKANLRSADLSGADLSGADFREANLREANLTGSDLSGADFWRANLTGADLTGAKFGGSDINRDIFREASLIGASLKRIDFSGMSLRHVDLTGVDFREANLIDAKLDGATLTDCWLWETQRAGWSIQGVICEAAYWDRNRQNREIYSAGEFERFFADKTKIVLHYDGGISQIEIVTLPALIQQMAAEKGCVVRLHSVQDAPGGATVTLVVEELGDVRPTEMAALKADLEENGRRLISAERRALEAEVQQRQVEHTLWYLSHEVLPMLLGSGRPNYSISIVEGEQTMGDKYIAGQVGAQGPGAHAHDMTFNQLWSQSGQSIDLQALATELTTLRRHLRQEAVEPEHDVAIGAVAHAEVAAKEGNGPKTLEWLGKAGKWTLDNAAKIGVGVATAALKRTCSSNWPKVSGQGERFPMSECRRPALTRWTYFHAVPYPIPSVLLI